MEKPKKRQLLKLERRQEQGSLACRRLRRAGRVPGVLSGRGGQEERFTAAVRDLQEVLAAERSMIDIELEGRTEKALVREVQFGSLSREVLHLDLGRIALDETLTVGVPLRVTGQAAGVRAGGVLLVTHHEVLVECLPAQIPEQLLLDVSALQMGEHLCLKALVLPAGVVAVEPPDTVVATVTYPEAEQVAAPAPEEAQGPELIRAERKEAGEEEAAEKGAEKGGDKDKEKGKKKEKE